jgi:hypothetical protein
MTALPTNITNLPAVTVAPLPARHRPRGMVLDGMQDCLRFAEVAVASGILSPGFMKAPDPVAAAFIAIQLGAEVGLSPMASLQNIAVINGKPGLYGPAMLAVVEASGMMEHFEEWIEGEGDKMVAYCKVKRVGRPERLTAFSWDDAKKARLTNKPGPWAEYPKRMMQARARSFALRDVFPDVLSGLPQSVEELQDIPAEPRDITPPRPPRSAQPPSPAAKPPLEVVIGDGWDPAKFPRGKKGLREALEFMTGAVVDGKPQVVALNNQLLDDIAEHIPELADEVSELRAAAAEALKPKDEDEDQTPESDGFVARFVAGDDDTFPGDLPPKPNP